MNRLLALLIAGTPLFVACGLADEEPLGRGNVTFTTWGEDYIERGIESDRFADGWSVHYDKFLVVIGNIVVGDAAGAIAGKLAETHVLDLTRPGPHALGQLSDLPAKAWDRVSYEIGPPGSGTRVHASATAGDLDLMRQGGLGVYLEGSATKGGETKTFQWGFEQRTVYAECKGELDGKETHGVIVTQGGTDTVELTIHGDHPFYDDLASPSAVLRFDAIAAADTSGDGAVTLDELTQVKLSTLAVGTYGVGAANIDDLGAFVRALVSTLGHFRGEGECISTMQ